MILRRLQDTDAEYMLEWMHDKTVIEFMKTDFMNMSLDDCRRFIEASQNDRENIHYAIDVNGEYLGTVSLKNIKSGEAEFAITIRKCAMGTGVSSKAMHLIIEEGFKNLGLDCIYWYVSPLNKRAVKFYDKNGYQRTNIRGGANNYIWYQIEKMKN